MTVLDTISADEMADVLSSCGFSPELRTAGDGTPVILYEVLGHTTQVLFNGYSDGRARSIQFRVRFADTVPLEVLNSLNEEKLYVKYYAQSDGRTVVELDCPLRGGVTLGHVQYVASLWENAIEKLFETK
jgi:hypothetical protein